MSVSEFSALGQSTRVAVRLKSEMPQPPQRVSVASRGHFGHLTGYFRFAGRITAMQLLLGSAGLSNLRDCSIKRQELGLL